jgi:hypothetical protein
MRRTIRILGKVALGFFAIATVVFGILCYILYAHEQEIADELIAVFNEGQSGQLTYSGVELSPFRGFPYISIDIKGVRFDADKQTEDDHAIYAFEDVYVGFDVFDLLRGEYTIRKLVLSKGHLFLEKYADGTYNITRAKARKEDEEEEGTTHLDLKRIELRDITLHEVNRGESGNELVLDILKADAYLSMIDDEMRMGLVSELFLHHYTSGNTSWFRELPFGLDCDMTIDGGLVTIHPSTFEVATGKLDLEGSLDLDKDLLLDLKVSGRKKNFDTFISFAPPEVIEKLKEFKSEGDIYFDGRITGPIDVRSPMIDLQLGCKNTVFHHTRHNKALRDVAFAGRFRTGDDGSLEKGYLELVNLYGEPEKGLMRGTIRMDNLLAPRITMDFHARFDLEHLKTFYELDAIEDGKGIVTIDVTLNEYIGPDSVLHFATKMTDGVTSNITFQDVDLKLAAFNKPFQDFNGKILLDGDDLRSEGLRVRLGKSDLAVDFGISNVSAMLHHSNAPVDLTLHGESKVLHMAELLALNGQVVDASWARDTLKDLRFDLDLHTTVSALDTRRYVPAATLNFRHLEFSSSKYPHHLDDVRGTITVHDELLDINDLTFTLGRNDVHADLTINNMGALLDSTRQEPVQHRLAIRSKYFNAKELLVYDGKPMIHDSIDEEVIHDLEFLGSGSVQSNTFTTKGFISDTHIDHFTVRLNNLPALRDVDGHILTDTSGCITLKDLKLAIGKSDIAADLYLRHFLDGDLKNKIIEGKVRSENLDLDEITSWSGDGEDSTAHAEAFNIFEMAFPDMLLEADIGRIRHHRVMLRRLHGRIRTTKDHIVHIDTLRFRTARGRFGVRGTFDGSDPKNITLAADLRVDSVELGRFLYRMDNFGQDYVMNDNISGRSSGTMRIDARMHPDLVPDLAHTTVVVDVTVYDGRLNNFAPLQALADFMGQRDLDNVRFGELHNVFTFRNGTLDIPEMKITSNLGYLYLSGKQNVDLDMDYTMRLPLSLVKHATWNTMKSKLRGTGRNREEEEELERADAEIISSQKGMIKGYLTVNVSGNPDDYKVRLGKSKEKR